MGLTGSKYLFQRTIATIEGQVDGFVLRHCDLNYVAESSPMPCSATSHPSIS